MIICCSCRSSFRSLLPFHSQNSRHISRPPRSIRGKRRGKPLIYIAPYVLGAQPFKSFGLDTPPAGLLPFGIRPAFVRCGPFAPWILARLAPPSPRWRLWLVASLSRLAAVLLALVLTLPAVAVFVAAGGVTGGGWCCTLAASLGVLLAARLRALWRGGWCWSVRAPCVALAGRVSLALARS